jgi:hypothetical protein
MSNKRNPWGRNWTINLLFLVTVIGGAVVVSESVTAMAVREVSQDGGGYDYVEEAPAEDLPAENVGTITTNGNETVTVETRFITNGSSAAGYRTFTAQVTDTLWYAWNRGLGGTLYPSSDNATSGWVAGLTDPNITIGYDFGVYDSAGVNRIAEGSTITQGTQVTLKFSPYVSDNIFWFGTGYSMDSPYGEWRNNANPPSRQGNRVTCEAKDLTQQYSLSLGNISSAFDVYVPFMVHPPTRTLTNLTGFSCGSLTTNGDGSESALCTATGVGSVTPTFSYDNTYGKFYYRYYDNRDMTDIGWGGPGCYGNNIPMSNYFGSATGPTTNMDSSIRSPYVINIPSQSFSYPVTIAAGTNEPPTPPTMVCPPTVPVGQDITVALTSSDPEGNQVRYGVGWYSSSTPDSGWTSFVNSSMTGSLTKVGGYSTSGTYTVYGWAQDTNNANSTASSCVIEVGEAAPNFNFQINGVVANGSLTVARDANLNIIWNGVINATSCTGTGNSWGGAKAITGGSDNISATAASLYQLSCTGPGGTTTKNISVTIQPTLKICQNSCSSNIEPPASFSMNRFDTRNLVACHNDAVSCTDATGDVTTSATWTEGGGNPVSLGGSSPRTLSADNVGTESIQASYSGNTVTRSVTVTCTDSGACQRDSRSQSLCQKDNFTVVDNCGVTENCTGEKTCDYNWKEVTP